MNAPLRPPGLATVVVDVVVEISGVAIGGEDGAAEPGAHLVGVERHDQVAPGVR